MSYSAGLISQNNPYEHTIEANVLADMGFVSGDTVYVKAYGDSFWSNEYVDADLNKKVFPNLNTTSADASFFIVP